MAKGISTRLTAAEGRKFGFTVGGAFVVLAAIGWWRGQAGLSTGLAAVGLALLAGGLAIPTYLGPVERAWMKLAHAISKVTTPIVMGIMYLFVITPIGILRRTFGGNPIVHEPQARGYWMERPENQRRSISMRRQF